MQGIQGTLGQYIEEGDILFMKFISAIGGRGVPEGMFILLVARLLALVCLPRLPLEA